MVVIKNRDQNLLITNDKNCTIKKIRDMLTVLSMSNGRIPPSKIYKQFWQVQVWRLPISINKYFYWVLERKDSRTQSTKGKQNLSKHKTMFLHMWMTTILNKWAQVISSLVKQTSCVCWYAHSRAYIRFWDIIRQIQREGHFTKELCYSNSEKQRETKELFGLKEPKEKEDN